MKYLNVVLIALLLIMIGNLMIVMQTNEYLIKPQQDSLIVNNDIIESEPEEIQEETEVTIVEEIEEVEEVIQVESYEPVQQYVSQVYSGASGRGADFRSAGVVHDENGVRYTWYSQNTLPGGGLIALNNNGRHVDEEGFIRDADGYIAVASCDHEKGTVVDTPFGEGKVYDYCGVSGTIDIYTNF